MKKKMYLYGLLIVLLLGFSAIVTYSIYRVTLIGSGMLDTAAWAITVKKTSTNTQVNNLNFGVSDITWIQHNGKNNKIAPGDNGYIDYTIDVSGSEVNVDYDISIGTIANKPDGMDIKVTPKDGVIPYASGTGAMTQVVRISVVWNADVSDSSSKDTNDIAANGITLTIPVTMTVKQSFYKFVVSRTRTNLGQAVPMYVNYRDKPSEAMADWAAVTDVSGATYPFYLRAEIQGGIITDMRLEFVISNQMAQDNPGLVAGTYHIAANEKTFTDRMNFLKETFDYENYPSRCSGDQTTFFSCGISNLSVETHDTGTVAINDGPRYVDSYVRCSMSYENSSNCYPIS